jgi:hypothetical protein
MLGCLQTQGNFDGLANEIALLVLQVWPNPLTQLALNLLGFAAIHLICLKTI